MKPVFAFATLLALTACVTPTYNIPPYDGYKRITFKADIPNRVYHYLCKPGESDDEVWARGKQAHNYANLQRKKYYKMFFPDLKKLGERRGVEERVKFAKDTEKYWEDTEKTMEARYNCIFYRTPDEARLGL